MNEGNVKQVKVDNWGIFFLQRLQQFFNRSEYCDLILQFSNNDQVKVHRLVLNACTEYFQTLEKQGCNVGACIIRMPADLQSEVVVPIINFMYTGRLEFRTELHTQLYAAAQQMNMTVLTKLLDAQALPAISHPKPIPVKKPLPVTWNLQGKKIVPKQLDADLPEPLPGRKLPIWKRRSAPTGPSYGSDSSNLNHEGTSRMIMSKPDEIPRPTRFEWPDEETQPTPPFTSSFDDISYETKPLVKATDRPKLPPPSSLPPARSNTTAVQIKSENRSASFEEVRRTAVSIKRPVVSADPNEAKKPKVMDLQAVKEYMAEHKLRKDLVDTEDSSEDVDDDLAVADMDDDDDDDMDEEADNPEGVLSGPTPSQINTPQKSILKAQPAFEESLPVAASTPVGSKKVRFSLDEKSVEGKENSSKDVKAITNKATTVSVGSITEPGNLSNHAKIITEVLKKYPHLVKNNKNIRLKIMQRGNQPVAPAVTAETDPNKLVKSKVSYVVLKSEVPGKGKSAVVLKHGGHVEPLSELPSQQKTVSGAENTTGPWLCHTCGTNEEPVNFETYYQYRRHLQDVHMEKIDARICEHCGHRASKRNLLLYHLYTRHNIPPPRNCQFPKCDQCDYVALSESLLIKHRNNHLNNKEFVCRVCNATFKSNGALQGHMQTNLHSDPSKKTYECPYCMKPFVRNINLKAHLRTAHKDYRKIDDGAGGHLDEQGLQLPLDSEDGDSQPDATGEENLSPSQVGQVMEVPVLNTVSSQVKTETTTSVMLAPTMTVLAEAPTMQTLVPSSEAEALSNVASGIAASLGLADTLTGEQTVIVLDENQEFILHTTEVVREETAFTEVQEYVEETQTRSEEHAEYIVPEIMTGTEENPPYSGQIPTIEAFSAENAETCSPNTDVKNCALSTDQAADAPPSLPSVTADGEEIALVLSDHDYAEDTTQKEAAGTENMMFIITQPVVSVASSNAIPVTSEASSAQIMSSLQSSGTQMVITNAIHDGMSVPVTIASTNGAVIIPTICERTNNSLGEVQREIVKVAQCSSGSNTPIIQQNLEVKYTEKAVEVCTDSTEDVTVMESHSSELPCSPAKTTIPVTNLPIRRMPTVEMADLVKEWDEFDEDSCDVKIENPVVESG